MTEQDDAHASASRPRASSNGTANFKTPSKDEDHTHHHNNTNSAAEESSGKTKSHKRRKVNHACVYCRRSHMTCDLQRPCARCIKRDIGHLCHDEPREPARTSKSDMEIAPVPEQQQHKVESPSDEARVDLEDSFKTYEQDDGGLSIGPPKVGAGSSSMRTQQQILQPKPVSPEELQKPAAQTLTSQIFDEWDFGAPNQFSDMHNLHPYNTFNTSEVTNEYNLLGDFLSTSLLDDGGLYDGDDAQALSNDPLLSTGSISTYANGQPPLSMNTSGGNQLAPPQVQAGNDISRPSSAFPIDTKARDKFYMTAADPAGNDTPEERMNKLLKAKYDAGMLKPFNYVKGYARLNNYMERNMRPASRQKILRQLNKFRPKFREAMQSLTDIQLVKVEMWFERSLMEYDRVFASMAIPACCWRRTGEIFRGNKEMAELIHVPIDELRDGKLAIHEIIVEDSLVSYWEKFGAIAFDQSQKAILTTCSLKSPGQNSKEKDSVIACCYSFTIRRDMHNIPSVIVGNFIPIPSS